MDGPEVWGAVPVGDEPAGGVGVLPAGGGGVGVGVRAGVGDAGGPEAWGAVPVGTEVPGRLLRVPTTVYSLGRSVGGADETEDGWTNRGYSSTGRNLSPGMVAVNPKVHPIGTVFRDPGSGEVFIAGDKHGNRDASVVDFFVPPEDYKATKGERELEVIGQVEKVPGSVEEFQKLRGEWQKRGAGSQEARNGEGAGEGGAEGPEAWGAVPVSGGAAGTAGEAGGLQVEAGRSVDMPWLDRVLAPVGAGFSNAPRSLRQLSDTLSYWFWKPVDAALGTEVSRPYAERIALDAAAKQEAAEVAVEAGGEAWGQLGSMMGEQLVMAMPQLATAGAASTVQGAVQISAAFGGMQSAGAKFAERLAEARARGEDLEEAAARAVIPALTSGAITGITTRAFGATGIENVLRSEGTKGFAGKLVNTLKQAGWEGIEEVTDEAQQVANDLIQAEEVSPREAGERLALALAGGAVLGGAITGMHEAARAITPGERKLAERVRKLAVDRNWEILPPEGDRATLPGSAREEFERRMGMREAGGDLGSETGEGRAEAGELAGGEMDGGANAEARRGAESEEGDGPEAWGAVRVEVAEGVEGGADAVVGSDRQGEGSRKQAETKVGLAQSEAERGEVGAESAAVAPGGVKESSSTDGAAVLEQDVGRGAGGVVESSAAASPEAQRVVRNRVRWAGEADAARLSVRESAAGKADAWNAPVQSRGPGWKMPVTLGALGRIRPVEIPELVALAERLGFEIAAKDPRGKALGTFLGAGPGRIAIRRSLFADPKSAAMTIAHEIGHGFDWLPDKSLLRGNVLGRVGSLINYLKRTMPGDPKRGGAALERKDRQRLRRQAEAAAGPKPTDADALDAWRDGVATAYADLVQREMKARGLIEEDVVREELLGVTMWWKPYDAETDVPGYVAYRESGKELYADAMSVLLNSPADLKRLAPTFYDAWFAHLDAKPDVRNAFLELVDLLNRPVDEKYEARQARSYAGFGRARERFEQEMERRRGQSRWSWQNWMRSVKDGLWWEYSPIVDREKGLRRAGKDIDPAVSVERFFEEHPLAVNRIGLMLSDWHANVIRPLVEAGIPTSQAGEMLKLHRIATESYEVTKRVGRDVVTEEGGRGVLANPGGENPQTAAERLSWNLAGLTPEQRGVWWRVQQAARDQMFGLVEEMHAEGLLTEDQMRLAAENRDSYVPFLVADYAGSYVPSGFVRQVGTLKATANPLEAAPLKMVQMRRAIQLQRAKRRTLEVLRETGEFVEAPTRFSKDIGAPKPLEPRDSTLRLMTYREAGRLKGAHVPADVAKMFEVTEPSALETAVFHPLNWAFRKVFYRMWISWNPAFIFWSNPIRDARRSATNLPDGVSMTQAAKERWFDPDLKREIREFIRGGAVSPLVREALQAGVVVFPEMSQASGGWMDPETRILTELLERYGVAPREVESWWRKAAPGLSRLTEWLEREGTVREMLPKLGTFKELVQQYGWRPDDAAAYVRKFIGTPNFTKRGRVIHNVQAVLPFTNIWLRGLEVDLQLATRGDASRVGGQRTKSAAGYWLRWALISGLGNLAKAAAKAGLLGAGLAALMARIPRHDEMNYDVVPLGEVPGGAFGGKTAYLRIPKDPFDRLLSGVHYLASKQLFQRAAGAEPDPIGPDLARVVDLAAADVPGWNPAGRIPLAGLELLVGSNPGNGRGGSVLNSSEWAASRVNPARAVPPFAQWAWGQSGAAAWVTIPASADGKTEFALGAAPFLNRVVKVSDYGARQAQNAAEERERGVAADRRLGYTQNVQELLTEYRVLAKLGDQRTPEQSLRFGVSKKGESLPALSLSAWKNTVFDPIDETVAMKMESGEPVSAERRQLDEMSKPFRRPR